MYRVKITRDNVAQIAATIRDLESKNVVIGYPEPQSPRRDPVRNPPTNAYLAYVHEYGSPLKNIPARPFLRPGIRKATKQIGEKLRQAAQATLAGHADRTDQYLHQAGAIGVASVRNEITTGNFVPLKPRTIANRWRQRRTQSMRRSELGYLTLIDKGMDPAAAQDAVGIHPLLNTGQLRAGVTYAIRRKQ